MAAKLHVLGPRHLLELDLLRVLRLQGVSSTSKLVSLVSHRETLPELKLPQSRLAGCSDGGRSRGAGLRNRSRSRSVGHGSGCQGLEAAELHVLSPRYLPELDLLRVLQLQRVSNMFLLVS